MVVVVVVVKKNRPSTQSSLCWKFIIYQEIYRSKQHSTLPR